MGYEKTFETRILRVKHKVSFSVGTRAEDLRRMLENVPGDATVDEILDDEEGGGSVEFHEERIAR
ncbi:MAG TPA: hypothetical protein VJ833_09960 [Rhodanobacteraceae bacterium]|nr:hypothetical protein [Rhodanobacteraceae bacterium]